MSEQSAKPYLVRAICEWCADNGFTPYLAVKVSPQTRVPPSFVKNGEIVLNISPSATRKLTIDNEWIQFSARFNGVSVGETGINAALCGHWSCPVLLVTGDEATCAEARDLLGTSRKYMVAILEHFDERRMTRRLGDDRVLGPNAPAIEGTSENAAVG